MAKTKTSETSKNVDEFIEEFAQTQQKRDDSHQLIELMRKVSGFEPKMWGPSIIGFGSYHYKYNSGHEGDAPLLGFSPRKDAISLYVSTGAEEQKSLIEKLGKFRMGKACIYVKKLSDIDLAQLEALMKDTLKNMAARYKS